MKRLQCPFSAIVEQNALKTALLLNAVDPSIGGVLIREHKGTGKSTAARALAQLLPFIALRAAISELSGSSLEKAIIALRSTPLCGKPPSDPRVNVAALKEAQ